MGQLAPNETHRNGGHRAAAIVVLGPGALNTARRVQACLPDARIHGLAKRLDGADVDVVFDDLGPHLRALYREGTPIIGLCAAGIVIRCLAQVIGERLSPALDASMAAGIDMPAAKTVEPPVLAIAEDASAVVPLLGGLGGVNTLARTIAKALAVAPAITTSGELRFGACLLDPPAGYALADLEHGKRFVSDLLAGESTRIDGTAPWLDAVDLPRDANAARSIRVSIHETAAPDTLLIHPRAVVGIVDLAAMGLGGHAAAPMAEDGHAAAIARHVETALAARGIARQALAAILVEHRYLGNDAVTHAASLLGTPVRFIRLDVPFEVPYEVSFEVPLAPSDRQRDRGAPQTPHRLVDAVRARLAAAGVHTVHTGDTSTAHRDEPAETGDDDGSTDNGITLLAAERPIDDAALSSVGVRRGSLTVIGLGPGTKALLAPAASDALARADDVLGYATYVDMAGPFAPWQRLHPSDNREELQRARHAFELAGAGRHVVIVSSGDPGIFAMAAAVLEALEAAPEWSAVQLDIIPGISAAMAGAAVAGAPLGHDFCLLSLSDNLKPWRVIERRLALAAEADLVIAFYNPISRARPWQLERALDIVRGKRAADTPVVLGRNIGRPGGTLKTVALGTLRAEQVDMRTVVIIGSSTTRDFTTADGRQWVYTPRSYPAH